MNAYSLYISALNKEEPTEADLFLATEAATDLRDEMINRARTDKEFETDVMVWTYNLASLYLQTEQEKLAEELLKENTEKFQDTLSIVALGKLYLKRKHAIRNEQEGEKLLRSRPQEFESALLLFELDFEKRSDIKAAFQDLEAVLEKTLNNVDFHPAACMAVALCAYWFEMMTDSGIYDLDALEEFICICHKKAQEKKGILSEQEPELWRQFLQLACT